MLPGAMAAPAGSPAQPASIQLSVIPPKIPADGGVYPAVVVSLIDADGLPTAAFGNVTVFLSSSQTNIASVPDSVTVYSGSEYEVVNVTTTATPGTTMITAHSEGLAPKVLSAPLVTVTPSGYPSKLIVFTSPSLFLPRADSGVVRVEVVDQAGLPSKAISSIPVSLSSSNSSTASLDQTTLTIPAGSIIADGKFHTSNPGNAVISATSTGYSTGTALVTVTKPNVCTGNCGPYKLALRLVPGTLPTDGSTYSVLEVGLQTSSGVPSVSSSDTVVQLTSDSSEVASVPGLVTIPAGSISTLAAVTTSALSGVANVTATSPSLLPATIPVKTIIPAPSKLQAYIAPPTSAYSSGSNYPILVLQLQDSGGNPARARQDTSVVVTSSNGTLLSRLVGLTIPKGSDYIFEYLRITGVGASTLTVTSQDLTSSQVSLKSVPGPLVTKLLLTSTSLPYIYENETGTFTFTATFDGEPLQDMNVTWATTAGTIIPQSGSTGTSGSVSTVFSPASFGAYNITVRADSPQSGPIALVYHLTVAQVPPKAAPSLVEQILALWYYIVAAAAVAVVAVVYLFRLRRKKQRAEIEAGFEVV